MAFAAAVHLLQNLMRRPFRDALLHTLFVKSWLFLFPMSFSSDL